MYENVKNLVGKKHKHFFDLFITELHEYGYNTYWKVLNAKDYGIPQNRERIYLIIIKRELDNGKFKFPKQFDNDIRLKDILEKEVDEKYYISQDKTDKLMEQLKNKNINNGTMFDFSQAKREGQPRIYNDISCTLTSRDYKEPRCILVGNTNPSGNGMNGCVYSEEGLAPTVTTNKGEGNKIFQVGNIVDTGNFENPQRGRIYSTDGICPALNTCSGGGLEPKILEDFYVNRDVREYENYSPSLRADRQGLKVVQGCSTRTRSYIRQPEQLEIRADELSNSITTVQKDSMAFETHKVICLNTKDENGKQPPQQARVYDTNGIMTSLMAEQSGRFNILEDKIAIENISSEYQFTKDKCMDYYNKNGFLPEMFNAYNQAEVTDIAPTQTTSCNRSCSSATVLIKDIDYKIRKLTPLECFRLMGFNDTDYYILNQNGISDSQIYKMAGNSIVTEVIYYILIEIYKVMPYLLEDIKLSSFFSGIGAFEKAIIKLQKTINNQNNKY